jgi:hypothetical protein
MGLLVVRITDAEVVLVDELNASSGFKDHLQEPHSKLTLG